MVSSSISPSETRDANAETRNFSFSIGRSLTRALIAHKRAIRKHRSPLLIALFLFVFFVVPLILVFVFFSNLSDFSSECVEDYFVHQSKVSSRGCGPEEWGSNPWIFEIYKLDDLNRILAYGIGTIHVPPEIVGIPCESIQGPSSSIYTIAGPIGDITDASDTIYGEIDLTNGTVVKELQACSKKVMTETEQNLTLFNYDGWSDRVLFETVLSTFDTTCSPLDQNQVVANVKAGKWLVREALESLEMHQIVRAADYKFAKSMVASNSFVDGILLGQAASSGGLEAKESACEYLGEFKAEGVREQLSRSSNIASYMKAMIMNVSSYVEVINSYGCGDIERMHTAIRSSASYFGENIQNARNEAIAASIASILNAQSFSKGIHKDETVLLPRGAAFAVGLAHWIKLSDAVATVPDLLIQHGYGARKSTRFNGKGGWSAFEYSISQAAPAMTATSSSLPILLLLLFFL